MHVGRRAGVHFDCQWWEPPGLLGEPLISYISDDGYDSHGDDEEDDDDKLGTVNSDTHTFVYLGEVEVIRACWGWVVVGLGLGGVNVRQNHLHGGITYVLLIYVLTETTQP